MHLIGDQRRMDAVITFSQPRRGCSEDLAASLIPQLSPGPAVVPRLWAVDPWVSLLSIIDPGPRTWKQLLMLTVITTTDFTDCLLYTGTDQFILLDSLESPWLE